MSTTKLSGLAAVQHLYLMQVALQERLDSGLRTPDQVKKAKEELKTFNSLLRTADPQYMGGEDVLQSLYSMHEKMSERVKKAAQKKK